MLAVAACINDETATFGIYCKEALCSSLLLASMARPQFSVNTVRSSVLAVDACINCETAIFGICYKEALCSPLPDASTARPRFLVFVIKNLCAHH